MNIKSEDAISKAMSKSYTGLNKDRKEQLLAAVRAVHQEKQDELHAIFTSGGLSSAEFAFYQDIVDVDSSNGAATPPVVSEPDSSTPIGKTAANGSTN